VFRPHGAERYASQAQLSLEEQLLAHAGEPGAPRLDAEVAARLLGADPERLQAQLQPGSAAAAVGGTAGGGLRLDQAAAAWYVLTSPRRADVMIGPAGTGKTRTAIEMARAWRQAGLGPVVALTASSNARNVLREEAARRGVADLACYNTAEWLGHAEGGREARDPIGLAPGTLITLDEASMMSIGDLAAVLRRAAAHGAKVVVTGDPMQLQAVEGGGGMALLTRHLGHVQLSEASRFRHGWERQATLRLRDGDVTVLTDYRLHDRLHAGPGEDMLEDAARAYLHDRLAGKDTLLMAGTEARAAELSRRVREDLIRWGIVSDGPIIRLRDGAHASAGDWIMARRNDCGVKTDRRGRDLTNRDVLRIIDTDPHGTGLSAQVVRLTGRDQAGLEQWSAPFLVSMGYLWNETHLAYAVTVHAAEGRTVDSGIAVFTGEEDRQATYVAMSRGRDNNEAFVIAGWRIADPKPGPEPAPELARQERLGRERAGLDTGQAVQAGGRHEPGMTAEQILARCLDRDGQQLSATDTRAAEWSDADRLDVLAVQ
jgi:ATP-dependent exoDNAse (exonuclease V) alpha subunit